MKMSKLAERTSEAVNDAEIFALLAALYNTNPNEQLVRSLSAIDAGSIEDAEIKAELERITEYAERTAADESGAMLTGLKVDWTKLFRGISPNYGPKPPYEELYCGWQDTVPALAAFYTENGYHNYTEIDNRPDYIGTQLDFLKALALRKVQAADGENLSEYERLDAIFIKFAERVKTWFAKFAAQAEKQSDTAFYTSVMRLSGMLL
jgi:TorA maturation chaperone TorD